MNNDMENKLNTVREIAEGYFRRGELFCSEAVLKTINDMLSEPQNKEIIKLSSGFAAGVGASGCLCGAVSGGIMALGLVYGRLYGDNMNDKMLPKAAMVHDHIKDMYRATCCRVLTKDIKNDDEKAQHCIKITGEVAYFVAKILLEDGVELNIK